MEFAKVTTEQAFEINKNVGARIFWIGNGFVVIMDFGDSKEFFDTRWQGASFEDHEWKKKYQLILQEKRRGKQQTVPR